LVSDDLCLDVAGLVQVALHEALAATEGGGGLTGGGLEEVSDLVHLIGDLHATSAATEGSLDGDGETELLGEGDNLVGVLDGLLGAGCHRCVGGVGDVAGGGLGTGGAGGLRGWSDPDQALVDDGFSEVGVLGEEAVAGVDSVCTGLACYVNDLVNDEVGLCGSLAAECEGLIGILDERGICVRLCVDGDRGDAFVPGCAENTDCNFTTVGDKYLGDLPGLD